MLLDQLDLDNIMTLSTLILRQVLYLGEHMDIPPIVILLGLIQKYVPQKPFDDNIQKMVSYQNQFIYWNTYKLSWPKLDLERKYNHFTILNYHSHSAM